MIKIVVTAIICFLLSVILFQHFLYDKSVGAPALTRPLDSSLNERVRVLESRLDAEIEVRLQLEERLLRESAVRTEIEEQLGEIVLASESEPTENGSDQRSFLGVAFSEENRNALLDAGFDEAQTERILELESKRLTDLFEARFGGTTSNPREIFHDTQKTIRAELGDELFERYLETRNRPTRVPIGAIEEGSAAEQAGLQVGDEIMNYDGDRVFSLLDLRDATQSGTAGQTVIMEVRRDNSNVSIAIPRGQIGISTSRYGFSRRQP